MTCDLCGGDAFEPVVDVNRPTSLRSDRVIVNRRLIKVACARCGLVRSGSQPPEDDVAEEYASSYGSATAEHFFYTSGGPIARSAVFADWLDAHLPGELWTTGAVGLEVGASAGQLMRAVHQRHPAKPLVGVEPNVAARSAARLGGVDIRSSIDEAPGSVDLAW